MMGEVDSLQAGTARHGGEGGGGGGRGGGWGDLFGVMIKYVLLSSFKFSALVNETLPLQSPFYWLGQSLPHRVVLQPLEFGSLAKQFEISAIIK